MHIIRTSARHIDSQTVTVVKVSAVHIVIVDYGRFLSHCCLHGLDYSHLSLSPILHRDHFVLLSTEIRRQATIPHLFGKSTMDALAAMVSAIAKYTNKNKPWGFWPIDLPSSRTRC